MRNLALAVGFASALALAQVEEKSSEHRTFSGVRELIVDNVTGFIHVTASAGSTVDAEIAKTLSATSRDRVALALKEVKLDVTQEGGLVRMRVDWPLRDRGNPGYSAIYDFTVTVPRDIALDLRTVNHSDITVEGTSGDFTISNVNGGIEMRDVEGSGTVRAVNGGVKVTFARNPQGPSSFRSVNGTLEVAFRPGLNADLQMKTLNGGLYTDFPVLTLPASSTPPEHRNGGLVWRKNRMTGVRIGSGGPELKFETVNGDVLIKNREK